ncbi:MerR family transcriptional regulator [Agarilytica rhodophyticola]|uniref:MerR family transcriptional regulator n=1 Tax=Agarilytica rhodophyticola TaxID=1737490 RepID=UPI0013152549|nr:MerR family transcriptional regulator [Agarilytica rhodophyticola]
MSYSQEVGFFENSLYGGFFVEQRIIEVAKYSSSGNLSIGTVSKLTGISVHTLRAWEKRHSVVSVVRSTTGRRLYHPDDVYRLRLLKRLTVSGHSIGNIAPLNDEQLEKMFDLEDKSENHVAKVESVQAVDVCMYGERPLGSLNLKNTLEQSINIRLETSEIGELRETLSGKKRYSVVMIFDTVQKSQLKMLRQLKDSEPNHRYFLVFSFAQREMIDELNAMGFFLLRAPISYDHLFERVLERYRSDRQSGVKSSAVEKSVEEIPPHKYTRRQLEKLSQTQASSVNDCEYTNQIAELIRALTVFESHCQHCEAVNTQDSRLHNDVYKLTAQARDLMERSMSLVLKSENINLDHVNSGR